MPTVVVTTSDPANVKVTGGVQEASVFAGALQAAAYNASSSPPEGWLYCDGSAVSRATYPALFTAIGTTWGAGDGSTTFNLPDLRGRILIGVTSSHADIDTVGETTGSFDHTHNVSDSFSVTSGTPSAVVQVQSGAGTAVPSFDHTHTVAGSISDTSTTANPPVAAINWLIKT